MGRVQGGGGRDADFLNLDLPTRSAPATAGCWQRDAGFRIDHLLLSPQAADRLRDAGVDKDYRGREKASDHGRAWVEVD